MSESRTGWPAIAKRVDGMNPRILLGLGALAGCTLGATLTLGGGWTVAAVAMLGALLVGRWGFSGQPVLPPTPVFRPVVERVGIPGFETLDMVALRGGDFFMEASGRKESVGPFRIQTVPVTRALFRAVIGEEQGVGREEAPANTLGWYQAIEFCNRLSLHVGLVPSYRIKGRSVEWMPFANGYRLPTEVEWEYACRADTKDEYFFGRGNRAGVHAWFGDLEGDPRPVGMKLPNPWGLHDMAGNVWEWCWDTYKADQAELLAYRTNAAFFESPGVGSRVLRGGSFHNSAEDLRSAVRRLVPPEDEVEDIGFRCVRGPVHPSSFDF